MPQAMQIELQLAGWKTVNNQLKQVAGSLSRMQGSGGGGGGTTLSRSRSGASAARGVSDPFTKALMGAIRSTRFSVGAGGGLQLMPLAGRMMDLAMAGGPMGVAMTATVAGLTALEGAARQAAQSVGSFAQAGFVGGGTRMETAQIAGLAGAIGMKPEDLAQAGRQFGNTLATNGPAMSLFNRYGIHDWDAQGIFGNLDKSQNLIKAIHAIRQMSPEDAIRAGRVAPELQPLLQFRNVSDATMKRLEDDARIRAGVVTPGYEKRAADFEAASGRVSSAFETAGNAIMKQFMPALTGASNWLADALNKGAKNLEANRGNMMSTPAGWSLYEKTHPHAREQARASEAHAQALAENTAAMQKLALVMTNERQFFGGGPRSKGAVPEAWRGQQLISAALQHQAHMLGALDL